MSNATSPSDSLASHAGARISVCMATWNGARFLREQIDSILAQLQSGDELVVSDDGSTDDTARILAEYGDRLRLVGSTRAGGVVKNFERALTSATGDLIALSDQDDVWLAGRIELIRTRLQRVSMLMMNGVVVDSELKSTGQDVFTFVGFYGGFVKTFVATKYVGCCMAFRRELLNVTLPFPAHIRWHDWYLALVGELLFDVEYLPTPTILFRRHGDNASTTGQRSRQTIGSKARMRWWMMIAVLIAIWRRTGLFRGSHI